MISLRKHIDDYQEGQGEQSKVEPAAAEAALPESVLSEFRAMLLAISEHAGRAIPNLGVELNRKLPSESRCGMAGNPGWHSSPRPIRNCTAPSNLATA